MKGLYQLLFSAALATVLITVAGCGSGDSGANNADGVKALANSPTEKQDNNPDVKVDPEKLKFGADGSKKAGK